MIQQPLILNLLHDLIKFTFEAVYHVKRQVQQDEVLACKGFGLLHQKFALVNTNSFSIKHSYCVEK